MAKVEKIKNELLDFDVFGSAKVFLLFEKQFKESLTDYIGSKPNDVNALAYALLFGHQSFCKLYGKDQVITDVEDILEKMDINELGNSVMLMLGLLRDTDSKKK